MTPTPVTQTPAAEPSYRLEGDWAERRFPIMGTQAHVLVGGTGAATLAALATDLLQDLERNWSRFLPDSEISRLNRRETMVVSQPTCELIARALQGHALTGGRFDPTMADRLAELGYDRSFDQLGSNDSAPIPSSDYGRCFSLRNDAGLIELDEERRSVLLPLGTSFDPGGLGKGLAADMVSERLCRQGARGVLINIGGDLRVRGMPPEGERWTVSIREPAITDRPLTTIQLLDGAVATSTTARRRWGAGQHHLLDPETGRPTDGPLLTTVVAGEGWWAEVAATALMSSRPIDLDCCAALRVHAAADGLSFEHRGPFADYECSTAALPDGVAA